MSGEQTTGIDLASSPDRCVITFRFARADFFSPAPARREWETANGRRLQAIDRYEDHARGEIVCVYEVIR